MSTVEHNRHFYDSITSAWPLILGKNFHWGLFLDATDTLESATDNLIWAMAEMTAGIKGMKVLDVGCGIGGPSIILAQQFAAHVTGISISQPGIQRAQQEAEAHHLTDQLEFLVADAMRMCFQDDSFDVAWVMESSHLMPEKDRLIAECYRVLRPGGWIVLCDLMLTRPLAAKDIVRRITQIKMLESSFGRARLDTIEHYANLFRKIGFSSIRHRDISRNVIPTIGHWEANIATGWPHLAEYLSIAQRDNFLESCRILRQFYKDASWGYGIISGVKGSSPTTE